MATHQQIPLAGFNRPGDAERFFQDAAKALELAGATPAEIEDEISHMGGHMKRRARIIEEKGPAHD